MIPVLFSPRYELNATDIDIVSEIIASGRTPTAEELRRYDVNGSGTITNSDLVIIRNAVESGTQFQSHGVGGLTDAISCAVTVSLNDEHKLSYELTMQYPVTGVYASDIKLRSVIRAKAGRAGNEQPFRVYRISKAINGIITVYARHIMYDLHGLCVLPFSATSSGNALDRLSAFFDSAATNHLYNMGFRFEASPSVTAPYELKTPASAWEVMQDIQAVYGGYWSFDGYTATLQDDISAYRGAKITYGNNMTDYNQDFDIANMRTGVMPFWSSKDESETVTLATYGEYPTVWLDEQPFDSNLTLDLSDEFETAPTKAELLDAVASFYTAHDINSYTRNMTVDFVQLSKSAEYSTVDDNDLRLGESVNIDASALYGAEAVFSLQVVETNYNVLTEQYDKILLGDSPKTLISTINGKMDRTEVNAAIRAIVNDTGWIDLGLASGFSPGVASGHYQGCAYRVLNGNHVYVAFNVAYTYDGSLSPQPKLNNLNIPQKYRPSNTVHTNLAVNGTGAYGRCYVSSTGLVRIEHVQRVTDMPNPTATCAVTWCDGFVEYFI